MPTPTEEPTAAPTAEPTVAPTDEPTAAPTDEPTAAPTEAVQATTEPAATNAPDVTADTEQDNGGIPWLAIGLAVVVIGGAAVWWLRNRP
jgi:5'-nucleotidase